ncbi:PAS domain-containing sensor histidine kinase [Acidimangrovimonas pyrenivorans]|uniref:histidine kinase n=1 Tax=Acidimangrovimonas pyrenivorans TaxID=2030798 RepID=A0ABV7ACP9_9RHOB
MDTKRDSSFERMLAADSKMRIFNDTVPAGILVIGQEDGRVVFSNRYFNEAFGVDAVALLGESWESFFVDKDERQELMVEFSVRDQVRDFELRLRGKDDTVLWGLASLAPIMVDDEELLLFAFSDVTKLKHIEGKLRELNEIKNRFLGMAAHDLRNPIGAIRSMSNMILKLDLDDERKGKLLQTISRTSDQMLALLNDLLDVSVIESSEFSLKQRTGSLGALLKERVALVSLSAEKKGIRLFCDIDGDTDIELDPGRVAQAIDNLLTNAVKYSAPDSIVETSARRGGSSVDIRVRDYGQGIAADEIGRIFMPFERLSSTPTAGEKSTGLGLAITKKIVEAHGGTVGVESTPGEGSTFTLSFPL